MRPTVRRLRNRIPRSGERPPWLQVLVRRLRVAATKSVLWALEGFEGGQGGDTEQESAENFSGIGFYSRPKADHRAEAIVAKVGGESGHPVIVATRDHDALKALLEAEGDEADVAMLFNSSSFVRVKKDGTVEIGSIGGSRQALATKADIDEVISKFNSHVHVLTINAASGSGGTGTAAPTASPASAAQGTQKLEAE